MAELGIISGSLGIISLAIQVADSLMKLKSFIDTVKEAPGDIKYLVRQIEALNLVLSSCSLNEHEHGIPDGA